MRTKIVYKLKEVREKKNLSLQELAEKSKVAADIIERTENNKYEPYLIDMLKIADALSVNIEELYEIKEK